MAVSAPTDASPSRARFGPLCASPGPTREPRRSRRSRQESETDDPKLREQLEVIVMGARPVIHQRHRLILEITEKKLPMPVPNTGERFQDAECVPEDRDRLSPVGSLLPGQV